MCDVIRFSDSSRMYLIVGLLIYMRIKREQDFPAFEVDLSFPEPASLIQQEEIILL